MKLRINEAILEAKRKGLKVKKHDIAVRCFPDSKGNTVNVNLSNLLSGNTKRVSPDWIIQICEVCHCDPNYLFGYDKKEE